MGFWLLVPGLLHGSVVPEPTGPVWCHSEAPALIIPGSRQPALTLPAM
jgi:hypothetical protein